MIAGQDPSGGAPDLATTDCPHQSCNMRNEWAIRNRGNCEAEDIE